jgi:hypothetical protein
MSVAGRNKRILLAKYIPKKNRQIQKYSKDARWLKKIT